MPPVQAAVAALLSSAEDAQAQFYDALREADLGKLMAVWAEDEEVVCIHPGGQRMVGLAAVRAGFEAMLSEGPLNLSAEVVSRTEGLSFAVYSLSERIEVVSEQGLRTGWVLATNIFVKTALGWRLTTHHASPAAHLEPLALMEASGLLH